MARLTRLAVAGHVHYVVQRGHSGGAIVADDADRRTFVDALREAARSHGCLLHAYAIGDREVHVLLSPPSAEALSRTMQALGRRYAAAFNRRHGRSGALWDGRFRAAVVEPGPATLAALRLVDTGLAVQTTAAADAARGEPEVPSAARPAVPTSAAQRLGGPRDLELTDPPEYWRLGNTPFEREARYRELCDEPLPAALRQALRHAALHAWAFGSPSFIAALEQQTSRPLRPRARGRPRRTAAA